MLPGTTTAIIGSTGSGKSTILSLLMRFYDPTKGSIQLNGIDIRELTQHALRSAIGYVPQRAFLFSGTIASNVGYSRQGMSQDTIDTALSIAQADEFVASRKDGLESPVSQGGSNVSGGQRQRLAIARALASDARVLLFDDSFSALDYATDAALRHALHERLSDRSVLIVAQRIATIRSADTILVLDEGRIVGRGTHDELMKSCETYQEIASSQLSASELSGGGVA
jgi:ATP-binding cassette subfamily B protein